MDPQEPRPPDDPCERTQRSLPAYLAGTLAPPAVRALRRHLRGCVRGCREALPVAGAVPPLRRRPAVRWPAGETSSVPRGRWRWILALGCLVVLGTELARRPGSGSTAAAWPAVGESFPTRSGGFHTFRTPGGGRLAIAPGARVERVAGPGVALHVGAGEVRWELSDEELRCTSASGSVAAEGASRGGLVAIASGLEVRIDEGTVTLSNAHGVETVRAGTVGRITPFVRPVVSAVEPP